MLLHILFLVTVAGMVGGLIFAISASAASNSLNILPPGGNPYGLSYSEHVERFWKWILAIPKYDNPFNDETGEKCATGQLDSGSPVFYLAPNGGGPSERTCKVPANKGLLIPVMHGVFSPFETSANLSETVRADQDRINGLVLKIDDRIWEKNDLINYRTHTESFESYWPPDNIFGTDGSGNTTTVADGWYILTEPLTKGNHTIHFISDLLPDPNTEAYLTNIKYHIIVE